MLKGKCVVVGVTGGIAAYKALELVSLLKKKGAKVHVIMTESATQFVSPLSFRTLSQNPVASQMFKDTDRHEVEHITLADKADLMVICPATANIIGKIAAGIADDMLSTTILATRAKIVIAPSMNVHMYDNPVTQRNIRFLKDLGMEIIEPAEGLLACGYTGKGKLPSPVELAERLEEISFDSEDLKGLNLLITAGPTREPIDPVRFISNHSSGKMGYALAYNAAQRGAKVTLISGPVNLLPPKGLYSFISTETAQDMFSAVAQRAQDADIIIKAAAVADFTPSGVSSQKIKKDSMSTMLELKRTKDILKELGQRKTKQVLVGFAAETQNIEENAKDKLIGKNLDFIVVNDVTQKGAGFGSDTNIVKIIHRDGHSEELSKMLKTDLARIILDRALAYVKNIRGI